MEKISILYKAIEEVKPYENNPRRNEEAVTKVKQSIESFGFKVPLVIDKDNVIVSGHTRLLAAKELGMNEVPTILADDLTPQQVKAFRIADNRVGEDSEWDYFKLAEEISEIKELDIDFELDELGFEDNELDGILELSGGSNYDDDDDIYHEDEVSAGAFKTNGNPVKDERVVTSEDVAKEQDSKKNKVGAMRTDTSKTVVCPHCYEEFEVK